MASNIILKKSSVVAKVPVAGDLQFGELALNYADGKLYYKKSDGTTIDAFQAGSGISELHLGDTPPANPAQKPFWWDSTSGVLYVYYTDIDGSQWVPATPAISNIPALPRTTTVANGTSITMNADTTDIAIQVNTQAAGTLTINAPTGTLVDGQKIMLRLTSTNAQTFSWNAIFGGSTDIVLPTTSSGSGKEDYIGFIYDSISTKWHLIAKSFGY